MTKRTKKDLPKKDLPTNPCPICDRVECIGWVTSVEHARVKGDSRMGSDPASRDFAKQMFLEIPAVERMALRFQCALERNLGRVVEEDEMGGEELLALTQTVVPEVLKDLQDDPLELAILLVDILTAQKDRGESTTEILPDSFAKTLAASLQQPTESLGMGFGGLGMKIKVAASREEFEALAKEFGPSTKLTGVLPTGTPCPVCESGMCLHWAIKSAENPIMQRPRIRDQMHEELLRLPEADQKRMLAACAESPLNKTLAGAVAKAESSGHRAPTDLMGMRGWTTKKERIETEEEVPIVWQKPVIVD